MARWRFGAFAKGGNKYDSTAYESRWRRFGSATVPVEQKKYLLWERQKKD
jgi:hypothetical protein